MTDSSKVWTDLKASVGEVSGDEPTSQSMATDTIQAKQEESDVSNDTSLQPNPHLHCLESGDATDYSLMAVLQSDAMKKAYQPSQESRELHNHKERLRRSRMKCSCDALRALVPGLTEKTDKATVLEHTVAFLFHLSKCSGVKCDDYLPTYPPPMSAKLLELYPTLLSGEYQYYQLIPAIEDNYNIVTDQNNNDDDTQDMQTEPLQKEDIQTDDTKPEDIETYETQTENGSQNGSDSSQHN